MDVILAGLIIFLLLIISEFWWRHRQLQGEFTRKFVHISVGSFVAFWPYFLQRNEIIGFSVAFLIVALLSKHLHIFQAIHSVQRTTWGEFWFALIVGLLALTNWPPHIFSAAILTMSLADGLAAVIGIRYGRGSRYIVFGSTKSVVGSTAFFIVSGLILLAYAIITSGLHDPILLLPIALGATLLENVAVRGFDNLIVPVYVAICLRLLT